MARKTASKKKTAAPAAGRKPRYSVFISHSSLDKWIAEQIAEKIEKTGAHFWLDIRDLHAGGIIQDEIKKGVRESNEVIVLFSPNSVDSAWVSFEIGAASALGRRFTPILNNVLFENVQLIQGTKAINLNDFSQYLSELKSRISKWQKRKKKVG